jgi:hypothetical protein
MTSSDYTFRRSVIKACMDSRIAIDWRAPTVLIAGAFQTAHYQDDTATQLRRIITVVLSCDNLEQAHNKCSRLHLHKTLSDLIRDDELITKQVLTEQVQMGRLFREKATSDERRVDYQRFQPQGKTEQEVTDRIGSAEAALLRITANDLADMLPGEYKERKIEKLLSGYDGTISYHVRASAYAQSMKLLRGEMPGNNDFFDLSHFLYIDKDTIMVSDDALIVRTCRALWPRQLLSSEEFALLGSENGRNLTRDN